MYSSFDDDDFTDQFKNKNFMQHDNEPDRIMEQHFGKGAFRDDEGDKAEQVKERPEPIEPEKAKEFIKEKIEEFKEEEDLGISPGDTITGAMIEEKYSSDVAETVKEYRRSLNSIWITCKEISDNRPSREMSAAITSLQIARQFCGKFLQERGEIYPYPNTTTKLYADSDAQWELVYNSREDYPSVIKKLKEQLQNLITELTVFVQTILPGTPVESVAQMTILKETLQAKMWLDEILYLIAK